MTNEDMNKLQKDAEALCEACKAAIDALVEVIKKAVESIADFFKKYSHALCFSVTNKRVVYLAYHAKKARVRKKNMRRIANAFLRAARMEAAL